MEWGRRLVYTWIYLFVYPEDCWTQRKQQVQRRCCQDKFGVFMGQKEGQ